VGTLNFDSTVSVPCVELLQQFTATARGPGPNPCGESLQRLVLRLLRIAGEYASRIRPVLAPVDVSSSPETSARPCRAAERSIPE